ncbi:MAG TPA: M1 family metallopeptidase, partial [Flavipsychrobacter sp.]|nr:M1 family metallopeptidase [Flavipsychrobacter sp.]
IVMRLTFITIWMWCLLSASTTFAFDRQDTLRGSNGRGRYWWDVQHYSLSVSFDTANQRIHGSNTIRAKTTHQPVDSLQLDPQELMFLDSVVMNDKQLDFVKDGNVWWIKYPFSRLDTGTDFQFTAYYHGKPRTAVKPPWDGGFIWTKDSLSYPWIAVACQGLGASVWWPCKDYQGDEPDSGMNLSFKWHNGYSCISNGVNGTYTLSDFNREKRDFNIQEINYEIQNPINTYNATFYIGDYVSWKDTLMGEKGKLDLTFCALRYHEKQAREQFKVVKQMLHCYEYWMGPYPFYEDGYKLVEAPYLGMEHQSAIAYGNKYQMGYLGLDRSRTGVGMLFDYIIVHESGHEWFGNNITAQDIADNWLHEGFTTYAEALFVQCAFGKEKAFEFTRGEWNNIDNDRPIIGQYGVNNEGSSDEYDKGAAILHMIRQIMDDDEQFRQLLRGLNRDFYHKIVTSAAIEAYISQFAHYNFTPLFNQYLRTTDIPKLEWHIKKKELYFRFTNVVDGFTLPIKINAGKKTATIHPTSEWQSIKWKRGFGTKVANEFLIRN